MDLVARIYHPGDFYIPNQWMIMVENQTPLEQQLLSVAFHATVVNCYIQSIYRE